MALLGLVLSGGSSTRMGRDKGSIVYPPHTVDQRTRCYELLKTVCSEVYISLKDEEQKRSVAPQLPVILDDEQFAGCGPASGILSASQKFPHASWFVLACDFPYADEEEVNHLMLQRDSHQSATAFQNADGMLEPLFAIWEPAALQQLLQNFRDGKFGPRHALEAVDLKRIRALHARSLLNVNSKADLS